MPLDIFAHHARWLPLAALLLGACTTAEDFTRATDHVASRSGVQGCVAGVTLGGLTGLLLAEDDDALEAAAIGAGAGLAAGCTAGAALDARRQDYAAQAGFYGERSQATRAANDDLRRYRAELRDKIDAYRAALDLLQSQRLDATERRRAAEARGAALRRDLRDALTRLQAAERDLAAQETAIARAAADAPDRAEVQALRGHVLGLRGDIDRLAAQQAALARYTRTS